MFFETLFGLEGLSGEQQVCCPFPHTKADGTTYQDHNPSMCINLDKKVYKCLSCGETGNEVQMCAKLFGTTSVKARNFITMLNHGVTKAEVSSAWHSEPMSEEAKAELNRFGIPIELMEEMLVTIEPSGEGHFNWDFPVFWNDYLIDIRHYRPGRDPKMYGEAGAPTGSVIPHTAMEAKDENNRWLILCAGEKDMTVTRSRGLNAITFTGGEMLRTPLNPSEFKNRKVAICYDNDHAGRVGAVNIANVLCQAGASNVRIINKFHQDFNGTDTKEDMTDWFTKYGGTSEKLIQMIKETPDFIPDEVAAEEFKMVKLHDILDASNCGQRFKAQVQVLTVTDQPLDVPSKVKVKKVTAQKGQLAEGEQRYFDLMDGDNLYTVFNIAGRNNSTTQKEVVKAMGITDKGLIADIQERTIVYVCTVADLDTSFDNMVELEAYCIGFKPVQGKRYIMDFTRTTDTSKGQGCLLVHSMEEQADLMMNWELTPQVEQSLLFAKHQMGSVADKIQARAEAVRGLLGYEADLDMITAIDLTFNTVKEFDYGSTHGIRGYMDTLIVGESRVGKSDTAKHLRDAYNVGAFVSLAGSAATLPGIVGGSAKDASGRQSTRAGAIPRNHESIICFEELAKADPTVLKSLTDVRSSGIARITRVSGSVEMPAALRMVTLSNVRPVGDGTTRPLSSYSGGIEVLTDLVGTAEDIARYDIIGLIGDPEHINPLYNAPEPYSTEVLQDLIHWVWTRKADNIKFVDGAEHAIYDLSTKLNDEFPLHIKIFGSECWKKLARLSIAAACYTVSSTDDFKDVLVTPEHVIWARDFMLKLYDSELFKLRDVVRIYKHSTVPNAEDTGKLQEYYIKYYTAIDMLYESGRLDKLIFKDLANIDDNTANGIVKMLVSRHFITTDRSNIYATVKFKSTYPKLVKEVKVATV